MTEKPTEIFGATSSGRGLPRLMNLKISVPETSALIAQNSRDLDLFDRQLARIISLPHFEEMDPLPF